MTEREINRALTWLDKLSARSSIGTCAIINTCMTALREKQEREKNVPLTLEELRGMDGEPVYIVDRWHCTTENPIKHWVIWDSDMDDEEFEMEFGKTVFVYRRPPEE